MTEATIAAAAPAAAPTAAPTPAPSPSPAPAPAPSAAPVSSVDPAKYPIREDYAAALLTEKLAAIPGPAIDDTVAVADVPTPAIETEIAPIAAVPEEEDFSLEPETIVTPELLSQMVTDHPEFGKLLETDARLKGQLYKTAREAAELKPYRALFPDLDSAQAAQEHASTWMDVRDTFLGSTTRDGTMASLSKIAELSYERGADGQVVLRNGKPVIGEDFFGFVNNVVTLDLEHRANDVAARLKANQYRHEDERARDQRVQDALSLLREDAPATVDAQPDALRRKADELDRRERALNARQHGEKVEERRGFESGLPGCS